MKRPSSRQLARPDGKLFTRPPFARFKHILDTLQRGVKPTRRRLAQECDVTVKTIQRDLDFMRDRMRMPIEFDPEHGGYRLTKPLDGTAQLDLTPGEMIAIFVTERALAAYRGSAVEAPLRLAFEKLALALDGNVSIPLSELGTNVSVRQFQAAPVDLKVFQTLATAVQRQESVEIDHVKLGEKKAKTRKVEPYHLACVQAAWYVIGHDLRSDEIRTFHLGRIKRVSLLGVNFQRPRLFHLDKYLSGALGIFRGKGEHAIVLRFDAWAAQLVRERVVHPTQRLQELTDGGVELRMTLNSLEEIEPWVLSWGGHVRVVGPKELIRRIRASGVALAANHGEG